MPVTNLKTALDESENISSHFQTRLLPANGILGQVLLKNSSANYDVEWTTLTVHHISGTGNAAGKNVGTGPNQVAAGNHNHDGVYEPFLDSDRKRKISYGTADPTGGNDGDIYLQYEDE